MASNTSWEPKCGVLARVAAAARDVAPHLGTWVEDFGPGDIQHDAYEALIAALRAIGAHS